MLLIDNQYLALDLYYIKNMAMLTMDPILDTQNIQYPLLLSNEAYSRPFEHNFVPT